jgi:hypothetical protein
MPASTLRSLRENTRADMRADREADKKANDHSLQCPSAKDPILSEPRPS